MIGKLLLAFFIGMPAVVMFVKRREMHSHSARAILTFGGAAALVCAAALVIPLITCKGSLLSGYSDCAVGSALIASAQPLIVAAGKAYILIGIPLAALAFVLDQMHRRA
ncbi:hypothetical protein EI983_12045 [Roseovarius faecimaris]|uniref:Uncharacterized protein n=1 Tax=Roseovarius faecimaris TaxID=2494550 RepID=A0A6I6IS05_9RHOB|nr:hypothetical protein [Roseovarius faecimaris]QGX98962.1 hypothetical protein EI983_12045 [Roseovarius faecimaris]